MFFKVLKKHLKKKKRRRPHALEGGGGERTLNQREGEKGADYPPQTPPQKRNDASSKGRSFFRTRGKKVQYLAWPVSGKRVMASENFCGRGRVGGGRQGIRFLIKEATFP